MDINLAFRPEGATHAGTEDGHGSWYKQNDADDWMFIDMAEDGLTNRQWDCCGVGVDPGYKVVELPIEHRPEKPIPKVVRDDGNAAFPLPGSEHNNPWYGMSLRDYFAAKYMQAHVTGCLADGNDYPNRDNVAAYAYLQADAMLAARGAS